MGPPCRKKWCMILLVYQGTFSSLKIKENKLVGGWATHLKNMSQTGNLPQIGVNMKIYWNHHLARRFNLLAQSELAHKRHSKEPKVCLPTQWSKPRENVIPLWITPPPPPICLAFCTENCLCNWKPIQNKLSSHPTPPPPAIIFPEKMQIALRFLPQRPKKMPTPQLL